MFKFILHWRELLKRYMTGVDELLGHYSDVFGYLLSDYLMSKDHLSANCVKVYSSLQRVIEKIYDRSR